MFVYRALFSSMEHYEGFVYTEHVENQQFSAMVLHWGCIFFFFFFYLRGYLAMSGDILNCHNSVGQGCC